MSRISPPVPEKPIDLVILLQDLEFGGTQRYALHLIRRLDRKLFTPRLWTLRGGDDMVNLARDAGVEPLQLTRSMGLGPTAIARLAVRLLREKPRMLYTMTVVPNIWGRLFGTVAKVPAIISTWRGLYPKQYESLLWRLSTRIIANARILKRIMTEGYGVPPERITVIPNGVDAEHFSPDPSVKSPRPLVTYVGRLVPDKDPLTLVEGIRLIAPKFPDAKFRLIGNGLLRAKVERFVSSHGLSQRVLVLPGVPDPRPALQEAHIFVMASQREAFPNAMLEAMACGLPVVAPRVGGIPELVDDGRTGLLFEPRNPLDLANALGRMLSDPVGARAMGQAGRERVITEFSLERMVRDTEEELLRIYAETVSPPE